MQNKSERLSSSVKKCLLVLFCLIAGGVSMYTVADNLSSSKKNAFTIPHIEIPEHIGKAGEEKRINKISISKVEIDKIRRFQRYMDSLCFTATGKSIKDSILQFRPGLMDSLRFMQHLYEIQSPPEKNLSCWARLYSR